VPEQNLDDTNIDVLLEQVGGKAVARIGITAVLHTWGSAMTHHPHIHMIVPGGGISLDEQSWARRAPALRPRQAFQAVSPSLECRRSAKVWRLLLRVCCG
jgi:hypothetical protein